LGPQHANAAVAVDEIEAAVSNMRRALQPIAPKATAVLIARLLAHFKVQDLTEREAEWGMEDLLDDLSEFPEAAVAAACVEWRRTQKWRPTIAELRELCIKHRRQLVRQVDRATMIAGAARAGWDVITAVVRSTYLGNETAALQMFKAWHSDR